MADLAIASILMTFSLELTDSNTSSTNFLVAILGSKKTLLSTKFVIAEVRHNHESFKGVYKLHEFISEMHSNGFVITMIFVQPFLTQL